jgi:hypothetical protein
LKSARKPKVRKRRLERPKAQYPLNQSPLYKLKTKKKLATLLGVDLKILRQMCREPFYGRWVNSDGVKPRPIQAPLGPLEAIHHRIGSLLRRIEHPNYLHSGVPGRTCMTNAIPHAIRFPTIKVDLKSFYDQSTEEMVFRLFAKRFSCSDDVARIMAQVTTCDGHIPTGSQLSQELAFWSSRTMFDEIDSFVSARSGVMTVWVDDIAITFPGARRAHLRQIGQIIEKHGHGWHKGMFFGAMRVKIVTGVVLNKGEVALPNCRHRRLGQLYQRIHRGSETEIIAALETLNNSLASAGQISPTFESQRKVYFSRLRNKRRRLRRSLRAGQVC